jgi:hypothetical protein
LEVSRRLKEEQERFDAEQREKERLETERPEKERPNALRMENERDKRLSCPRLKSRSVTLKIPPTK